jgi:hypothetical protein
MSVCKVGIPRPKRVLKIGEAIHAVIAISANPYFVISWFALVSSQLFPQDNNVNPNHVGEIPSATPIIFNESTTIFDVT